MATTGRGLALVTRRAIVIAAAVLLWIGPFIFTVARRSSGMPQPTGAAPARALADAFLSDDIARSRGQPALLARLIAAGKAAIAWRVERSPHISRR
ncbi:hypothetical protein [Chelatococcus reniformis]|uniref:Uncharacterized protein n=1 Tax=Chelatococcus reniformis TaxID=1494448 RepID=A0A916UM42_9HYPH|nr:hypothetical protein [Chelatococcus reniformis]GGC77044.1 hypothetical protein GCM10010994_39180 [Chelatococcus reniformis]